MKPLLIATTNPAKFAEYSILLRPYPLTLYSLADMEVSEAPEETGSTFAENAALKARFYFERCGIATLADDGGLEVDALGGEPGVRSNRWLGKEGADDQKLAAEVIRRMSGVKPERRTARLRAAVALVYRVGAEPREYVAEAALDGIIADRLYEPVQAGFPYRAVLFLPALGRYVAELSAEEAARLSQRRRALEMLAGRLSELASDD
jgi:XTP/dITP diphosphohydrolase